MEITHHNNEHNQTSEITCNDLNETETEIQSEQTSSTQSQKRKRKLNSSEETINAIRENSKSRKLLLEQEYEQNNFKIKTMNEEHQIKMQIYKKQLMICNKIYELLEENPTSVNIQLSNV